MGAAKTVIQTDISISVIRKVRNRLIPLLFLLYLIAYLDRTNIGFAALTMNADLGITSTQFGFLTGIFFWGYCLFEIPSNLLLHKLGARTWIARILVSWGIVAAMTGFVRNAPQLYAARFVLGIAEAGFYPGVLLYLSYWFRRRERAQMIALFMTAVPVSNLFGAPLSGFILDHVHWLTIASWRWLLVLEGLPAIFGGAAAWLLLPNGPTEASFLSTPEKGWIRRALAEENSQKLDEHKLSFLRTLAHRRVWHIALVSFAFQLVQYSIFFWMPQAMKSLSGYSNTAVGILVMIPHLAGLAALIPISLSSDRMLERRYHVAIPMVVGSIALILLGATHSLPLSVALWSVAAAGAAYGFVGPFWSLPDDFLTGAAAASGIALVTSIGSLGGFVGPSIMGITAGGSGGIYRGLAIAGISSLVSATLALLLPKKAIKSSSAKTI
jgi:sugar phosphate permease